MAANARDEFWRTMLDQTMLDQAMFKIRAMDDPPPNHWIGVDMASQK